MQSAWAQVAFRISHDRGFLKERERRGREMNCSALGFSATIQGELATLARGSPELPPRREEGRRRREWPHSALRLSRDRVKTESGGGRWETDSFRYILTFASSQKPHCNCESQIADDSWERSTAF